MSDTERLLELIEEGIVAHGGDLGGWTQRGDDTLKLFDGRVSLRAVRHDEEAPSNGSIHIHVLATLHDYDDEVLDACLVGVGKDREQAVAQAAMVWLGSVAGPIKSLLDDKPVCMTWQAGAVGGDDSSPAPCDFGLPGLRAYVGPPMARGIADDGIPSIPNDAMPWFRFAAESAAPHRVHIAKVMLTAEGKEGWRRELEVDGHEASHHDPDWGAGLQAPRAGYVSRFAMFEFPQNSAEIRGCAELDRAIGHFAQNLRKHESVGQLMQDMVAQGFEADMVKEVESIATIAFGRIILDIMGAKCALTIIRARRDGRIEMDIPLMSLPAYARARALAKSLHETMSSDDFQALCLYSPEANAVSNALENSGGKLDLSTCTMSPCVVPDRDTPQQTLDAAWAAMQNRMAQNRPAPKKPWWKIW